MDVSQIQPYEWSTKYDYQMVDYLALVAIIRPCVRLRAAGRAVLARRGAQRLLERAGSARGARVGVA